MGQKVHPIGVRLGIIHHTRSNWYANKSDYALFIKEDHYLRNYIFQNWSSSLVSEVEIERRGAGVRIRVSSPQVRQLVGSEGQALEQLRSKLKEKCKKFRLDYFKDLGIQKNPTRMERIEVQIFVHQLSRAESNAQCLASFVVTEVEKRVPFRRVLRLAQERAQNLGKVRGLRLQVSGRLNGAEIARTEWLRIGRVPLQTLSADIDYSCKRAHTIYGLLGVKVWVFRPEKNFDFKLEALVL
jgi:small subunit ribosomal protein S3